MDRNYGNHTDRLIFDNFNFDLDSENRYTTKYMNMLKGSSFTVVNKIHQEYCTQKRLQQELFVIK